MGVFPLARLKPGVTWQQVQTELDVISARVLQDHPTLESVGGTVVPMDAQFGRLATHTVYLTPEQAPSLSGQSNSGSIPGKFSVFVWHSNLRQLRTRTPRLACGSNDRAATPLASLLFLDPRVLLTPILVVGFGLDGCPQRFRYFTGDVVLNHQDIVEGPVVDFRPDNIPVVRANQPRVHPQPAA